MSREILGERPGRRPEARDADRDPYLLGPSEGVLTEGQSSDRDGLDASDGFDISDDLDDPAPGRTAPGRLGPGQVWVALLRRAPLPAVATLALAGSGIGWFAPDLLAAASPPPPLVVATLGYEIEGFGVGPGGGPSMALPVHVINLGQTPVQVTGASAENRPLAFSPIVIAAGATGEARLQLSPSCRGAVDAMTPRLQVVDPDGSSVSVGVLGVEALLEQSCLASSTTVQTGIPTDGGAPLPPGIVVRTGAPTRQGTRLVLSLQTSDDRSLLLTAVDLREVPLRLVDGPVRLDGTARQVVLEPPTECPATVATDGPATWLSLTVTPTGGSLEGTTVVELEGLAEAASWLLHTACSAGIP